MHLIGPRACHFPCDGLWAGPPRKGVLDPRSSTLDPSEFDGQRPARGARRFL